MEGCLISGEAGRGGAWGIDLRRLGCGCGRRLVTDSCCVLSARRPEWVVRGLGRAFLYLSIYLSIYLPPHPLFPLMPHTPSRCSSTRCSCCTTPQAWRAPLLIMGTSTSGRCRDYSMQLSMVLGVQHGRRACAAGWFPAHEIATMAYPMDPL